MKRTLAMILSAIFCLVLVGCDVSKESENHTDNLSKANSVVSNNNRNFLTSEDEDFIYFFDFSTVKKMSKTDSVVEAVYTFESTSNPVTTFECFEDRLYFLTYQGDFISMDKDGKNLLTSTFSLDASEETLEYVSPTPTPYIFGDDLYFIVGDSDAVYRVDPDTLTLEHADSEILSQYITSDKTIFTKKIENELGRLYVTPFNGNMTLFSAEDESVILSHVNYTNSYVFYMAFKLDDPNNVDLDNLSDWNSLNLYRVDLDGKNKVLIKEFDLYNDNANIRYDNEYIYLSISGDEYLKINKETLEETNIISVMKEVGANYEISNEKIFQFGMTYCIDSETGEKIEF